MRRSPRADKLDYRAAEIAVVAGVQLVWWDGTGLCLMAKKLESGGFKWPGIQDGVMRLTAAQLGALLEGLDWRRVHGGRRPQAPQIAG